MDTHELMVNIIRCIEPQVDYGLPNTNTFVSAVMVYILTSMVMNHILYYIHVGVEASGDGRKTAADTSKE